MRYLSLVSVFTCSSWLSALLLCVEAVSTLYIYPFKCTEHFGALHFRLRTCYSTGHTYVWGNVVPKKRTVWCLICYLNPHGAATYQSRRCLWSDVRVNTGSHIRFCSDLQPLGGKLRDSYKLLALKKWIYLHSCSSTWLQQRSAELASVFGRSCAVMYTANRSWRAQTFTDEVMFKVLFMPSFVLFCVSPVFEAAPLSWISNGCTRSPKTLAVEAQAEGFWDCVSFAVGY